MQMKKILDILRGIIVEVLMVVIIIAMLHGAGLWLNYFIGFSQ